MPACIGHVKPMTISPNTAADETERQGDGVTSTGTGARAEEGADDDREGSADGEDAKELQDEGHSKRRRLREPEGERVDPQPEAREDPEEGREEVRVPRTPPSPGKPTERERRAHNVTHYPYRSWCRHCARGRGASRHHRGRSDEDRAFSKGRVPTISLDHCFLGADAIDTGGFGAVEALSNPFLILYDADTEAIYSLPVSTKACTDYVVYVVRSIIEELGYGEVRISLKCDAAPELGLLR